MRAFRVSVNEKKICLAGVGDRGVLSAIVNWVADAQGADLFMEVGGLANEEHVAWVKQRPLNLGDEIRIKVVEASSVDGPTERRRIHPAEKLNAKKRYVRMVAKELGWTIQPTHRVSRKSKRKGST
jgi:hypothetical protein